ncbi:hypothetical protein MJM99_29870, partial [Salmonella enterica subsp. enterica serovar Kentucky]|nr:hypothetical protein [Salmonella enterica subsp. enterica serovar Kentucky]
AGTEAAVLMVESEAELLSEDTMLGAVVFGHEQQQVVIQAINDRTKIGLTSRIIPTYRRPMATRSVARDNIEVRAIIFSDLCLQA